MIALHLGCGGQMWGIHPGLHGEPSTADWINVDVFDFDVNSCRWEGARKKMESFVGSFPRYVQASMTKLPFPDNFADYVCSNHSLEHVHPNEVAVVLAECHRVLKPGGKVMHRVPDLLEIARKLVEKGGDLLWSAMGERTGDHAGGYSKLLTGIYGDQPLHPEQDVHVHRTGFTPRHAGDLMGQAGFRDVVIRQVWAMEIFSLEMEGYK